MLLDKNINYIRVQLLNFEYVYIVVVKWAVKTLLLKDTKIFHLRV